MAGDLKKESTQHEDRDDLSDAASSHLEQQSLKDEDLPSYSDAPVASAAPRLPSAAEEKSALARQQYQYVANSEPSAADVPNTPSHPSVPELSGRAAGPTASAPFNFPVSELPAYEDAIDIVKPLAIPQVTPSPDAPLVSAFSRQLLSYGIPAETWYNFVDTLSAFISANISQQAIHHAADFAGRIAEYHKQYAYEVTKKAQNIGKQAQRLQLSGVIGGVVGLATHSVGHVVGTVFHTHRQIWTKPRTPRERATVYIATANEDWFHSRGLHALLLDTQELANVLGLPFQQLISSVNRPELTDPVKQLGALSNYIAEVEVREEEPLVNPTHEPSTTQGSGSGNLTFGPSGASFTSEGRRESGNAAGKRPVISQIQLGASTLWLVLTQESKIQAMEKDAKGNGKNKARR